MAQTHQGSQWIHHCGISCPAKNRYRLTQNAKAGLRAEWLDVTLNPDGSSWILIDLDGSLVATSRYARRELFMSAAC